MSNAIMEDACTRGNIHSFVTWTHYIKSWMFPCQKTMGKNRSYQNFPILTEEKGIKYGI